jgi:hypothetical protein
MTTLEADVRPSSLAPSTPWLVPALYAVTLFASALLLFVLQPMFAKMVLPRLGGAQSVWSVAMVFFQGALLLGYGYAHLLSRTLPPGRAALTHLIVLATAALALPIGIAAVFDGPPASGVAFSKRPTSSAPPTGMAGSRSAASSSPRSATRATSMSWPTDPFPLNPGSFAALMAYPFVSGRC